MRQKGNVERWFFYSPRTENPMKGNIPGLCGKHTQEKQSIFGRFVEHHINIVKQIYNNKGQSYPYHYFDVFAGPGWLSCRDYDGPGSPLIFKRVISSFENINYQIICSENNPIYQATLQNIPELEGFELKDNALDCCSKYPHEWHFGMAYIDPPMTKDSLLLLEQIIRDFARYWPQIDIVLYISAGYIKRFTEIGRIKFSKRLTEFMDCVDKDWIIREPIGSLQYTFLVGTKINKKNNKLTWGLWSKQGFYEVNSYEGQKILLRLNYNEKEQLFQTYGMRQGELWS